MKKENIAWLVIITSLTLLIFLAYKNITGFVISTGNLRNSYLALLAFLIVLIATFYLIHINKRKYK